MNKRKRDSGDIGLREKVCSALDITPDMLPGAGTVEIRGRNSVNIKEGGRILLYTPEKITVSIHHGRVSVIGKRLVCAAYVKGDLRIDGYVESVAFEEEL